MRVLRNSERFDSRDQDYAHTFWRRDKEFSTDPVVNDKDLEPQGEFFVGSDSCPIDGFVKVQPDAGFCE